jgi:hypothetical protein
MRSIQQQPSRDADLRAVVHQHLETEYGRDIHTTIVDEFALCRGQARIDIAVLNGALSGYELKSGADHLRRLPGQVHHYNRIFDAVTMVVAPVHAELVVDYIPGWYGLWIAEPAAAQDLIEVRAPGRNPALCARSICQLLWREEMLSLLCTHGLERGLRGRPRRDLITAICLELDLDTLARFVREYLRDRHAASAREYASI